MDWTDRHCRYFHRLLSPSAMLYSEMVTTGAILFGDRPRHLDFNQEEHPLALQLGGNDPTELAACARIAEDWGYDEVNLNVGCPSSRVQKGIFGACLMREPQRVRDCLQAMRDAVEIPVSIKTRLGVDELDSIEYFNTFVSTILESGVTTLIVHARKAWLSGLSPKQNREVPPLNVDWVYKLKAQYPELNIVLNGGITTVGQIQEHLQHVDGVMLGRAAYQNPWLLVECDSMFCDGQQRQKDRASVLQQMIDYAGGQAASGLPARHVGRHLLGLMHARPGGKAWRRHMSACLQQNSAPSEWLVRA